MVYKSVDELIGNTPMLELCNIEKEFELKGRIFAKLEYLNPGGSIKDRVAKAMLDDAENRGIITKDSVIIEPTSGNTGIGLASVGTARGYRVIIVMPDSMSVERRVIMSSLGAEVVLTPGSDGMTGAIKKAEQMASEIPNSFIPSQFENKANPKVHYDTTGVEIYNAMDGDVDFFVAGVGTGGTISGIGKYLKEKNECINVVAVEPLRSAVLSGNEASAHKIQGIGAGFIPEILDTDIYDEIYPISDSDAFKWGRIVGKHEGILVGISSGAALCAAVELAGKDENKDKKIVVIFPDTGDRYLSTQMFTE